MREKGWKAASPCATIFGTSESYSGDWLIGLTAKAFQPACNSEPLNLRREPRMPSRLQEREPVSQFRSTRAMDPEATTSGERYP